MILRLIIFPGARIERELEPDGEGEGWLVIRENGHAWLHGDRAAALREKAWHDRQWRRS